MTVALKPTHGSDVTSWTRTSVRGEPVVFGAVQSKGRVRLEVATPHAWRVDLTKADVDADNFQPDAVDGAAEVAYNLSAVHVRGLAFNPKGKSPEGDLCAAGRPATNGEFYIPRVDMNATLYIGDEKTLSKPSLRPKPLKYQSRYLENCSYAGSDGKIHVFSVASGTACRAARASSCVS